jgi:hypothetical protein
MAAHDRIRLTGQLRRGPARAGPLYLRERVHTHATLLVMLVTRVFATVAVAAATALAGCGGSDPSDEEQVESLLRAYLVDVYEEDDFESACARLAGPAQRDLVTALEEALPQLDVSGCEDAMEQYQQHGSLDRVGTGVFDPDPPRDGPPSLADLPVTEIAVDGDRASARVGEASVKTRLVRIEGDWKIARLDPGD